MPLASAARRRAAAIGGRAVIDGALADRDPTVGGRPGPPEAAALTGDDLVDDAVLLGLLGTHEEITLHVAIDDLDRPAGVEGEDLVDAAAHSEDLLRVDLDVGGLPGETAGRLVDQDAGV